VLGFLDIAAIVERHERMDRALREDAVIRDIHRLYSSINEKSSSLFGHVSLMIAACTFLAGQTAQANDPTPAVLHQIFLAQTFAYIIVALTLLPVLNINMYRAPADRDAMRAYFARSIRLRSSCHRGSLIATWLLTSSVMVALEIDVLYSRALIVR